MVQFRNARVFSEGKDAEFGNRRERACDMLVPQLMTLAGEWGDVGLVVPSGPSPQPDQ